MHYSTQGRTYVFANTHVRASLRPLKIDKNDINDKW